MYSVYNPWLVEPMNAEPVGMEGGLWDLSIHSGILVGTERQL